MSTTPRSQVILYVERRVEARSSRDRVLQSLAIILKPLIETVVFQTSASGIATTKGLVAVRIKQTGGKQSFEVSSSAEEIYRMASTNELETFAESLTEGLKIRDDITAETLGKRCLGILKSVLEDCAAKRLPELLEMLDQHATKKQRTTVKLTVSFRGGAWCGVHIDRDEEIGET